MKSQLKNNHLASVTSSEEVLKTAVSHNYLCQVTLKYIKVGSK